LRVHDGAETPSTISLKQVSTIAEMRIVRNTFHGEWNYIIKPNTIKYT